MDAILGFLNNPLVLAALGAVVKFVPGIRSVVSNKLIPYITTAVAWLSGVFGPADANAAGLLFGLAGPLAGLGSALWQSAQAWVLHEFLLRGALPKKPADSK